MPGSDSYSRGGLLPSGLRTVRNNTGASITFHQHGHHVQKAHGRRVTLATDGSHLSGGMIALMPTAADAKRLAVGGGEKAADLHITLFYLGNGDAMAQWSPDEKNELVSTLRAYASEIPGPLTAKIFGIAHWNAGSEDPSWVWSVGDDPDSPAGLMLPRSLAVEALENMHEHPDLPPQHTPWVPHVCAAYTDDLSLAKTLEQRLGPVTFDRIRVSFGDEDSDVSLSAGAAPGYTDILLTAAAGPYRREPSETELAAGTDFAGVHDAWESAVDEGLKALRKVFTGWRAELHHQIVAKLADDNPEALPGLSLDTHAAVTGLDQIMEEYALRAGRAMQREAESQGVTVPEWHLPEDAVTAAVGGRRLIESVARMTSDLMASNLITAAKRKLSGLLGSPGSPEEIADQVSADLGSPDDTGLRAAVGTAMTAAQNAGRRAVLEAAPIGDYYASEIMDRNTCGPCKAVDGEQFSSLEIAVKAYPVMGYKDCVGPRYGNSCRGFIVARWKPEAEIASAAATMPPEITEGDPTVTETLGGKPNPGTKPDKRLDDNAYDDTMDCPDGEDCGDDMETHFTGDVVELTWDGAASRFTDPQYQKAAAACDPGQGSTKERCFLPHHEPGGALNKDGVHAAAQRVSSLSGHDPAAVARAKAHLRGHYATLKEEPPDSIKATIEDEVELAFAARAEAVPDVAQPAAPTAPWRGPLTVEGKVTGDGREFAPGALDWAELPLPLRWNRVDSHGGEPRTEAVNVGNITRIWRDGDLLMGEGLLDLGDDDGQRVHHKIEGKFLKGVSIDADSISNADVEYVMPEGTPTGDDADLLDLLMTAPEKTVYHGGRIRGATLCDIPAFAEAYIALLDEDGAVIAGGQTHPELVRHAGEYRRTVDGLVASSGRPEWLPPAEWFTDPKLSVPTGITVDDYGRVYGHAAMWGACHIGREDICIQPPHEDSHPYYMTGEMHTREGGRVAVGQVTVGTGHAPLSYGAQPAAEHYDNTGSAVADVAVGNDAHGIWIAGAIRPGADPLLVHELRASGQVSGDWRRIGGKLRMVGLLAVNVPGFPVPKVRARVASGEQQALVAAGRPTVVHTKSEEEMIQQSFKLVMDMLFARVHEGRD